MKTLSITATAFVILLSVGSSQANELPSWRKAKGIMEQCYSGFDMTITLSAGLDVGYQLTGSDKATTGIAHNDYSSSGNSASSSAESYTTNANRSGTGEELSTSELETGNTFSKSVNEKVDYSNYSNEYSSADEWEENRFSTETYAGIKLTVPLYSRETRLSRREKTASQVKALADLYAKYEGHRATAAALHHEQKVLKQLMLDGGQAAISAYYGLLAEKEKSKALMISSKRTILYILESCK